MALRDREEILTRRLLIVAAVYTALLVAVQVPTVLLSVRYARLSTDILYEGSLTGIRIVIMVLSPLSNYIRVAFLAWVTFYYGKKNSVTVLIITIGSLILSAGMEASPDRTSDVYFTYDWNTHLVEYGIRFLAALIVTFVIWFAASALGSRYRRRRHHNKKLPTMKVFGYGALFFLAVDLVFQFYFYLDTAGKGTTALDWIDPFVKAGCGFLLACGIGMVLTKIRRSIRAKEEAKKQKEQEKAQG